MADNPIRKNSNGPVNNDGPGKPRIETPITGPESPNPDRIQDVMKERMERYAKLVADQKKKMMDVDKDKLVNIIFRQNSLISQQSSQMIDLVNLVNELDGSASQMSEDSQVSVRPALQQNINILKKRNELCQEANQMREDNARIYSGSVKIQFVLFTLFILVLLWLLYHYMSFSE
jgi:uncharacterized membrane protein (DUF106 family)